MAINRIVSHNDFSTPLPDPQMMAQSHTTTQNKPIDQDLSTVLGIDAFNDWVENDPLDLNLPSGTFTKRAELEQRQQHLGDIIITLQQRLLLKKVELDLALAERDFLSYHMWKNKIRRRSKPCIQNIELEHKKCVRINGVSRRCGSYTAMMNKLSNSVLVRPSSS